MQTQWEVDSTKILTRTEMSVVLDDLRGKAGLSRHHHLYLIIFRLSACCGLRASEIAGLTAADVRTGIGRPHIIVRAEIAKGGRARRVPLWWDAQTLEDLTAWKATLQGPDSLFVSSSRGKASGGPLSRQTIRDRFLGACRVLGKDRLAGLTVHHGRHSFISHALAGQRTLAEVRNAAGHSTIATTSIYTHVAVEDGDEAGNLFEFAGSAA